MQAAKASVRGIEASGNPADAHETNTARVTGKAAPDCRMNG